MSKYIFLISLIVLTVSSAAADSLLTGDPAAIFSSLEKKAVTVKTLSSDFVQEKHLSMFKTVLTSKGRFYFSKPDLLRWELVSPVASGFVLKGEKGRRWHQLTGKTESFQISQEPIMKIVSDQLFAWGKADFQWLNKEYRISVLSDSPVALRLEPRSAETAGFLHHLLINFSSDGRYVRTVELHEKDGDFTRIRFVNAAINKPLPANLF